MMESKEVNPAETDETCRQVKLISKILSEETIMSEWMNIFKGIINKSSKHRMNFVFVMQFFRLNNQFEMSEAQIYPLYCLITEFLEVVIILWFSVTNVGILFLWKAWWFYWWHTTSVMLAPMVKLSSFT